MAIDIFAVLSSLGQADTAAVEAFLFLDGQGVEHYDTPVAVACFREARRRLVTDSGTGTGAQIISEATVYLPVGTVCPVHSFVTLSDSAGRRNVLQVLDRSGAGLPTPDHLEVLVT